MIPFNGLEAPRINESSEKEITILELSDYPGKENLDDFKMFICKKAEELGTGKHAITYKSDENEIRVKFKSILTSLSRGVDDIKEMEV